MRGSFIFRHAYGGGKSERGLSVDPQSTKREEARKWPGQQENLFFSHKEEEEKI